MESLSGQQELPLAHHEQNGNPTLSDLSHHVETHDSPILSFCLPTFNNAWELETTLDSIIPQIEAAPEPVELVISDNASTDDTQALCESFAAYYDFVRYHRNESNVGFDLNILNSMELASGSYCWLFGDDLLRPGALAVAIAALREHRPSLVSFNFDFLWDGQPLRQPAHVRGMKAVRRPTVVTGSEDLIRYRSLWITFISALVVVRDPALIAATRQLDLRGFAHVFYVMDACRDGTSVLLPDVVVVTQWSTERPWTYPPLPTFTECLPAMFDEFADEGYLSRETAKAGIADTDYFVFPKLHSLFMAVKTAERRGTAEERRCYAAAVSRRPPLQRFIINRSPAIVHILVSQMRALRGMKRALVIKPSPRRQVYRDRFAQLPMWKRLLVVAYPAAAIDSARVRVRLRVDDLRALTREVRRRLDERQAAR